MKRKIFYLILPMCLIIVFSCTKSEKLDIKMTVVDYGNLNIQVIDDNGSGISNVDVQLLSSPSSELEEGTTDAGGNISFNNILSGEYYINIKKVSVGGIDYTVNQNIQVISNVTKDYKIKPTDYSGTIKVTVIDEYSSDPLQGLHVVIFPNDAYNYGMSYSEILAIATETGVTDALGVVNFTKLPLDEYSVLVYQGLIADNIGQIYYSYYLYNKGQEVDEELSFYMNK
jgi:SdrD B-like domain